MSKRKYKKGRLINSILDFEFCGCNWFWCFGGKTMHRTVLENQQYAVLKKMIIKGHLYTAERIEDEKNNIP